MPVIFICILILVVWIRYESNKSKKINEASIEKFWAKERKANNTRNQSIDALDYIQLPMNELPLQSECDLELSSLQDTLHRLSESKIVNLSMYTNTELKLKYGTGRFQTLAEYDQNYTSLLQTIEQLGSYHMSHRNISFAIWYYEYAHSIQDQNAEVYVNLAKLYSDLGDTEQLNHLKDSIQSSDFSNKTSILRKMEQASLEQLL